MNFCPWKWFFLIRLQEGYENFHPPTWGLLGVAFKLPNIRLCLVTNSRAILVIQNNLGGTPWVGYLVHKLFDCETCCAHDNKCCTQFPFARKGCTLCSSRSIKVKFNCHEPKPYSHLLKSLPPFPLHLRWENVH
jgi:hypothetical protein